MNLSTHTLIGSGGGLATPRCEQRAADETEVELCDASERVRRNRGRWTNGQSFIQISALANRKECTGTRTERQGVSVDHVLVQTYNVESDHVKNLVWWDAT